MGNGYWILLWDAWGMGLNMINPRIYTNSKGDNWFNCDDVPGEDEAREIHGLTRAFYPHVRIVG